MTKITYVSALSDVIAAFGPQMDSEVLEKLTALRDKYAERKPSKGTGKPTAHQTENALIKSELLAQMKEGRGYQVMDMAKEFTFSCGEVTPNRLSAIVTQLKNGGEIIRYEEKRKAFFRLATEEDFALEALEV